MLGISAILFMGCTIQRNGNAYSALGNKKVFYVKFDRDALKNNPDTSNLPFPIMEVNDTDIDFIIKHNPNVIVYLWNIACPANDSTLFYEKNFKLENPSYTFVLIADAYLYAKTKKLASISHYKDRLFVLSNSYYGSNFFHSRIAVNMHFGVKESDNRSFYFKDGTLKTYTVDNHWQQIIH